MILPILHGEFGEDGTIQGLATLANIPCVGPNTLGSAICMDKDISKQLLKQAGLNVADSITFNLSERENINFETIKNRLGLPFFVKPATTGSSVGVQKIKTKQMFTTAVNEAFSFSNKILFEKTIIGREIECAILGNNKLQVSLPGEIIPKDDFYSYIAKYLDKKGAELHAPAKITEKEKKTVQTTALQAFRILQCSGMARVDGFLTKTGQFVINEINTIPGFTKISMYPKLWEVSGLPYPKLLDKLIRLAIKYK